MFITSLAFHLFAESSSTAARKHEKPEVIELAGATAIESRDGRLATSPGARAGTVVFEKVIVRDEPLLAMTVAENGPRIRVNGLAAGPVQVLRTGDALEFLDEGPTLHVTLFARPYCGPAREEHEGRECPVCLARFGAGDQVLVCVHCQAVLHEGSESG